MKKLTVFSRVHEYPSEDSIAKEIKVFRALEKKVRSPFILERKSLLHFVDFAVPGDKSFISSDFVSWICEYLRDGRKPYYGDYIQYFLDASIEDTEWTVIRNKNLGGKYYQKLIFKEEFQMVFLQKLDVYLQELIHLLDIWKMEDSASEQLKIAKLKKLQSLWFTERIVSVEPGRAEAVYGNSRTSIFMVSKNDEGILYSYPKRMECLDSRQEMMDIQKWTTDERSLGKWLNYFGPFSTNQVSKNILP